MDEFNGKVVLVTGAARGAGRAIAVAFSSLGAQVAANDINPVGLDQTIDLIEQAGGTAKPFVFDVAKRMPVEGMIAQVLEDFGRIDILVNHASVAPDASLLDTDEWEFHRALDVNLGGPFFTIQQVGRVMREQGGGAMVNLISIPGRSQFTKGYAAYIASRAGLVSLTRVAAQELAAYHIRLNTLCSGYEELGLTDTNQLDGTVYQTWLTTLPNVVRDEYDELIKQSLFLCSSASGLISGQVLTVEAQGSSNIV